MRALTRLAFWFRSRRLDAELAEEIETHRALRQAQLERSGMSAVEARAASRRAMGNVTVSREDARSVWVSRMLEQAWKDARCAVRMLARQPSFTASALLTLALGVGATTTVFSLVETAIWRPLPFAEPHRLVAVFSSIPSAGRRHDRVALPEYVVWHEQTDSFDELSAFGDGIRRVLRGYGAPQTLSVVPVAANFFQTLRLSPSLGRTFTDADGAGPAVAILSGACWRRVFGASPRVVGQIITLDDRDHAIIGVAGPDRLEFTRTPDVFVPIDPRLTLPEDWTRRDLRVFGRLREGATLESAKADLSVASQRLAESAPDQERRGAHVEGLREAYTGWNWRPLYFFFGAALFVLLLTCANVAHLVLARALGRHREFAIRRALGGGTGLLVRQLLVEGTLLALPGAAIGLILAAWGADAFLPWLPPDYLGRDVATITLDGTVYLFAMAVSGVTSVAFGLAPVLLARANPQRPLAQDTRWASGSRLQRRARHALVVSEIAIALVLLFGSGLFLTSLVRLTQVPLGFDPRDRVTVHLPLAGERYIGAGRIAQFADDLVAEARAVPGVRAAAVGSSVPLASGPLIRVAVDEPQRAVSMPEHRAIVRTSTPGYFAVLDIRRVAGRDFTAQDGPGAVAVAIVNETGAQRLFPGENPVGRRIRILPGGTAPWIASGTVEIVGVVANSREVELDEIEFVSIYRPLAQNPMSPVLLVARTIPGAHMVVEALRARITSLDPTLPIGGAVTMEQRVDDALRVDRFHLLLIAVFAMAATLIAGIGIYGAMSFAVEQRMREFGVRVALGADRQRIFGLTLGLSMRLAVAGALLGIGAAVVLSRVLRSALFMVPGEHNGLLYGVGGADPASMAAACAAIAGVCAVAGIIPARRATNVDPAIALRGD